MSQDNECTVTPGDVREYLTVSELALRIKFSKQTVYNLISAGKFEKGRHYLKPSRKKILFIWSGVTQWLEERSNATDTPDQVHDKIVPASLIKI